MQVSRTLGPHKHAYSCYRAHCGCSTVGVALQVYLTTAAVRMKRVVALDILLKPRPADTEQGEGGDDNQDGETSNKARRGAAGYCCRGA